MKALTESLKLGVCHFNLECDVFVADRRLFSDAESFLKTAIDQEDCGYEMAYHNCWAKGDVLQALLPFVKDSRFVVHRCTPYPWDDIDEWWELVDKPGRGHVRVWTIDMREAEDKIPSDDDRRLGVDGAVWANL